MQLDNALPYEADLLQDQLFGRRFGLFWRRREYSDERGGRAHEVDDRLDDPERIRGGDAGAEAGHCDREADRCVGRTYHGTANLLDVAREPWVERSRDSRQRAHS